MKTKTTGLFIGFFARHLTIAATLLFAVIGFLIYSNTFGVTPRFDDSIFIFDRMQIRNIGRIWAEGEMYRKIPYMTFALNYFWTGQRVWSWHLVNLLFHLAATFTVYGIARTIWRSPVLAQHPLRAQAQTLAVLTGLVFLCHPIQTSAVTYIYQRTIVIATLFHALALYGYARARIDGRPGFFALFAGAGILACFTKQVNMSLPVTVFLMEVAFCSESVGQFMKRGVRFVPLALIPAALYSWMMKIDFTRLSLATLRSHYPQNINSGFGWNEWIPTELNAMRTYLRLLIFPMNQTLDYDYPVARSLKEPAVLVSMAVIAVVLGLGLWCWKRHRPIAYGIFFIAATLSVEFFAIRDILFEHRLYLPMIGFALAAPPALCALLNDRKKSHIAAAVLLAALSAAAFARNAVWADEEKFWKEGILRSPNKGRPYYTLGVYYALRGEHAKAIPLYQKAIEVWPSFADAYSNLGKSIEETGHMDQAINYYAKAVELDPTMPEGLNNYGSALTRVGRYDEARKIYGEAIRRKPDNFEAYSNMGSTYAQQGNYTEAELWYRKSIAANPLHADAHNNLGSVLGLRKDYTEAEKCYREAIRLRPDYFEAHNNLAVMYVWQNRLDEALTEYREAVRLRPDFAEGHNNMGSLLARRGIDRYAEAEEHYQAAVQLRPDYADPVFNLGNLRREQHRMEEAEAFWQKTLTINPNHEAAKRELDRLKALQTSGKK